MSSDTSISASTSASAAKQTKRNIGFTVLIIVVVISVFIALVFNRILQPRILSKDDLMTNGAIIFDQPRIVKDFALIDQDGQPFSKNDLEGKWTMLFYGFTQCPDICPMTLLQINQVIEKLDPNIREQVQVGLVTLDPARDTPELLKQYVASFNPDYFALTGDFLEILKFARNVNVAFTKVPLGKASSGSTSESASNPKVADNYTIDHTGNIVLLNPYGDYHGFFKPPFELAKLKLTLSSVVQKGVPDR